MLRLPLRESLGEYPPKKFRWRTLPAPFTNSLQPLDAKRGAICIECARQSVGEKRHRVPASIFILHMCYETEGSNSPGGIP